jgi:tetratricopeptide (TPR) repeat protein
LARFIADVTEQLDLSAIYSAYDRHDGQRQAGYHPLLLTRLLLYGYCVGVASSRAIDDALWRHDVARDTADFTAQYNLGAILQLRGQTSEALPHYQAAVALRPTDAIANNALGCVLLALGQTRQAIAPLQAAIQSRPDYFASNTISAMRTPHFTSSRRPFRISAKPCS